MQKYFINIQHFKTFSHLIICLLNFTRASSMATIELPTAAQIADGAGCQIPADIQDLSVKLHPLHNTIPPGSWVKDLEIIYVECNNRTGISGGVRLLCNNGQFNSNFPSCTVFCDGNLLKGLSTVYHCNRNGHYLEPKMCSSKILPNTEIEIFCAVGYKRSNGIDRQKIRCLPNGMFDVEREKCDLECGLVQPSHASLRRRRSTVEPNHVPWHVSIYERENEEYVFICTGSIISPTLVISAAHCFWDNLRLELKPIAKYQFIAGKYKRKYNLREDKMPQIRETESIQIGETFRGQINGFDGDVALIKLKEPFIFNDTISAVCMLQNDDAVIGYVESGILGAITGYARNNTLQQVPTKTIDFPRCSEVIEGLSSDKLCLIVENDYPVCIGGSGGGGFVVREGTFYYLSGIVSYTTFNMMECVLVDVLVVTTVRYMTHDLIEKIKRQLQEDTLIY